MRHTTLLFLLLTGAISVTLFSIKYQVQDLEDDLDKIRKSIIAEHQAIHVLEAEWSHLNNPERLGDLARRHLGMRPVNPAQLTSFKNIEHHKTASSFDPKTNLDLISSFPASDGQ